MENGTTLNSSADQTSAACGDASLPAEAAAVSAIHAGILFVEETARTFSLGKPER
jgi:hypothetical protein